MPLRDGFFSTATQTSCCNRIQRSNRVRLLVVSTHDFPDTHLHTQAESGAYLRDSSRVPRRRPFMKPPYAIGSVPSLSGHAIIAYRWRSLPRVRRHRACKPQGSSERVLPWQVTMDQLISASLSHTHYWYEVGMLKVPGECSEEGLHAFRLTHTHISVL